MMLPFIRKPLKNYWGCQKGLTGTLKSSACCPLFHPYSWPFLWRWVSCTNKITFDCNSWTSESREKQLADYREWGCPRQTREKEQEKQVLIKATSRLSIFPFVPWSSNIRLKSVIPATRYTRRLGTENKVATCEQQDPAKCWTSPDPRDCTMQLQQEYPFWHLCWHGSYSSLPEKLVIWLSAAGRRWRNRHTPGQRHSHGWLLCPCPGDFHSLQPSIPEPGILNQNLPAQLFASNVLSLIDVIWEKNLGLFLGSGCCCFLCIYTKETAITRIILHYVHA